MKSRFDELLPFYVNGTLPEADRAWVDGYLREHPNAGAELNWHRSLQSRLREDVPAVSSEVGLERAMRRIRSNGPVPQGVRGAAGPSLLERLRDWFASVVPQPVLRPAFAGALAVVALQTAVIVGMVMEPDDDTSELRAIQQASVADEGPYLKVNFDADAREADIRLLLVEVNGSLAAGPGQLGDYYVRVPAERLAAITDRLKASEIVDGVAVVDALPGRP
jgi:anti-sigma factor RsiW